MTSSDLQRKQPSTHLLSAKRTSYTAHNIDNNTQMIPANTWHRIILHQITRSTLLVQYYNYTHTKRRYITSCQFSTPVLIRSKDKDALYQSKLIVIALTGTKDDNHSSLCLYMVYRYCWQVIWGPRGFVAVISGNLCRGCFVMAFQCCYDYGLVRLLEDISLVDLICEMAYKSIQFI